MIVRIMTDNQYELSDAHLTEIQRLDDELEAALNRNDATAFDGALQQLIGFVRQNGQVIPTDDLRPSDLMIPAPDMTLAEAQQRLHPVTPQPQSDTNP